MCQDKSQPSDAQEITENPPSASSQQQVSPAATFLSAGFWGSRLDGDDMDFSWIWEGFLAAGNISMLTSQWKSGKTTMVSILLSRLKEGGQLAGLKVAPARAVILSEESPQLWRPRHKKLDLGHIYFFCRPFVGKPSLEEWLAFIDHIAELRVREGLDLFIVDTLATFLPGNTEANAATVMKALLPVLRLTKLGMALLFMHHPRKGVVLPGQAARGSGALGAFVDIIIERNFCARAGDLDRRRKLLAFSRHSRTPAQCVIELNPEGTDYVVHGDFQDDEFAQNWTSLRMVLEDAAHKLRRTQILADWPADFPCPSENTLTRWLDRGRSLGLVLQEGTGRKNDPFRYWLPEQEAKWKADPLYDIHQMIFEANKSVLKDRGGNIRSPEDLAS
jgi:hypothetical protein